MNEFNQIIYWKIKSIGLQTLKQNTQVKSPGSEKERGGAGGGGVSGGGGGAETTAAAGGETCGRGLVRKESVSTQTPSARSGAVTFDPLI